MNKKSASGWIVGACYIGFLIGQSVAMIGDTMTGNVPAAAPVAVAVALLVPFLCGYMAGKGANEPR